MNPNIEPNDAIRWLNLRIQDWSMRLDTAERCPGLWDQGEIWDLSADESDSGPSDGELELDINFLGDRNRLVSTYVRLNSPSAPSAEAVAGPLVQRFTRVFHSIEWL